MRGKSLWLGILAGIFLAACSTQPTPKKQYSPSNEQVLNLKTQAAKNMIEHLSYDCEAGDASACDKIGAGYDFLKDYAKAFKFYQKSCDLGETDGCVGLASLYERGLGVGKSPQKAIEIYKNGCNDANAAACLHLAQIYKKGELVERDYAMAMGAYVNACTAGDLGACVSVAQMYEQGLGAPKDKRRAFAIYKASCFRGFNEACVPMKKLAKELGEH